MAWLFRPRASLHAEILVLRHQLNVLQRKSPKRLVCVPKTSSLLITCSKRLPADTKRVSNPATGKFKSSHKRLNPGQHRLGDAGFL
jgi:hypothetical protein